jgi:hypothetical protein
MKKTAALIAALFVLWGASAHALPLSESDYLRSEEEHFDAADVNKSGLIEREEANAAYADAALMPNENARAACIKAGKDISAQYRPSPDDKNYRAADKEKFMQARKSMFAHIDTDRDHVITQREMEAFSNQMIEVCTVAPQMMNDLKNMQNSDSIKKMTPEQRNQMLERLRILQGKEPTKN